MKILVFDNYDSFTYNLVHIVKALGFTDLEVHRNDKISLEEINKFDKIILSPGPGIPSEAGILLEVIKEFSGKKPILGVCLGHQAIGEAFGGKLINLSRVFHGVATSLKVLKKEKLFNDLPDEFMIGRYHSWAVSQDGFPKDLEVTAIDENGQIMALRHKTLDIRGVQFHPESILTEYGEEMMRNWLKE